MAKKSVRQLFVPIPQHIGLHPPVSAEVEPEVMGTEYDGSEKLEALTEWRNLTPLQKKIVVEKLKDPEATQAKLAERCKCSLTTVVKLVHSNNFDKIADELARAAKKELVMEATSVMRGLMRADSEAVRLKAAMAVLADAGLLKDADRTVNQNKNIQVSWKK